MVAGFRWGNLKERDHLENLSIGGAIILKWILKETGWKVMTLKTREAQDGHSGRA
jgi:hypothetical protein